MGEVEKIKIDILRDALKDVADTIRAMDRKIQFIVGYNGVFLGFISTIFLNSHKLNLLGSDKSVLICLGLLSVIWVFYFMRILSTISPYQNPLNIFKDDIDKNFANNTFFVLAKEEKSISVDKLVSDYDASIKDEETVKKLLYKEISKLSYIRDSRIERIKEALIFSSFFTVVFVLIVLCAVIKNSIS